MRDVTAWIYWLVLLLVRFTAKIVAPIAVLLIKDRKNHPVWGVSDTTDFSYWNVAVRNSAHNFLNLDQVPSFDTWAGSDDHTLEQEEGFQWRYRRSKRKAYVSFRMTWGKPRAAKGKRELYLGWTLNETPKMRPVLQLRPW